MTKGVRTKPSEQTTANHPRVHQSEAHGATGDPVLDLDHECSPGDFGKAVVPMW